MNNLRLQVVLEDEKVKGIITNARTTAIKLIKGAGTNVASMKDVRIDLKIRNVAKVGFGDSEGFTSKLDKLRKALRRSASGVFIGGVSGKMGREQDARILAS